MADTKNIFISHVHEDDDLLPKLKDLRWPRGDGGSRWIHQQRQAERRAKRGATSSRPILDPQIDWASTLVVLITHDTAQSGG